MALTTEFKPLGLGELRHEAAALKADGWRFVQTHAVNGERGIDLYYSFMKDGNVLNYRIEGVTSDQPVPSITDLFLAAFVFENEARELFGVNMRDIAIDFHGSMYAPAQLEPMTFISPEQKKEREKALKVAAAKAAKAAKDAAKKEAAAPGAGGKRVFVMAPELQARLDAKYPSLSDEKKAKVDAALAARKAEAEGDGSNGAPTAPKTEEPSNTGAEKPKEQVAVAQAAKSPAEQFAEEQLETLINQLDDAKAATVRAALAAKGGE